MLTLAPERYTAGLCMVKRLFHGVSEITVKQTRLTCITTQQAIFYGSWLGTCEIIRSENIE